VVGTPHTHDDERQHQQAYNNSSGTASAERTVLVGDDQFGLTTSFDDPRPIRVMNRNTASILVFSIVK